jgi:hypothetical protein
VCTEQNTAKCCHVAYGLQSCLCIRHFSCRCLKLILSPSVCNLPIFHLPQHLTLISNFFPITCKYLLIQFISNVNKTTCHHLPFPSTSVWPESCPKICFPNSVNKCPLSDVSLKTTLFNYPRQTPHSLTNVSEHNLPYLPTLRTIFLNQAQ